MQVIENTWHHVLNRNGPKNAKKELSQVDRSQRRRVYHAEVYESPRHGVALPSLADPVSRGRLGRRFNCKSPVLCGTPVYAGSGSAVAAARWLLHEPVHSGCRE